MFSGLQFGAKDFGLGRVVGVVGSEAGGFVVLLFVSINILDIPER